MAIERLANAGATLAQATPGEAFAKPDKLAERRDGADAAFAGVLSAYDAWKAGGAADPTIDADVAIIKQKQEGIKAYRAHVDAGAATQEETLGMLQRSAAAGLDLTRRAGATIGDLGLARLIDGFHALMQVNDGQLIEINLAKMYLAEKKLPDKYYAFLLHGLNLRDTYGSTFRENLPAQIVAAFDAFENGPQAKTIAMVRESLNKNAPDAALPSDIADLWSAATAARAQSTARLISQTAGLIDQQTQARAAEIRLSLIWHAAGAASVILAVLALCVVALRNIAELIRSIAGRMKTLAEGETTVAAPHVERRDEIGEMARAVEVFRQAAIRNRQLEASAEAERRRSERERVDVQAKAEREAEQRLDQATKALAAGVKRLAAGDLMCEIDERLAPQFEALREDFNASIRQLRGAMLAVGQSVEFGQRRQRRDFRRRQ